MNIKDKSISEGDGILAIGAYKNNKITPVFKVAKGYGLKERMELKCRYLGFDISASIDDDNNLISISVNGQTYDMAYIEAIGHMVVLDKNTGKVKVLPGEGYGFRNEEIGVLLRGKEFIRKSSDGDNTDLMPQIGLKTEKLFNGADFLKAVKDVMDCDDGYGIENVYDIHKRLMFCHLVRVKNDGQGSGVYVFMQDKDLVSSQLSSKKRWRQALKKSRENGFRRKTMGDHRRI